MTTPSCPVCLSVDCQEHFRDPSRPMTRLHVCKCCGMAFVFPRFSEDENRQFTSESYDYGQAIYVPSTYETYRRRVATQVDFVTRQMPRPGCALDVGCYNGDLLDGLHERGWRCTGIESSHRACEMMRQQRPHICVHRGFVEDQPFLGEQFDLVIVSRTLNHMPDPVQFLRALAVYASEDTRLYIEVSALESVLRHSGIQSGNYFRQYLPCVFSATTLVDVLNQAGWGGLLNLDTTVDFEGATTYLRVLTSRSAFSGRRAARENALVLDTYRDRVDEYFQRVKGQIEALTTEGRRFVTWGAGEIAGRLFDGSPVAGNPSWLCWIDSFESKWGSELHGRKINSPMALPELKPELIVITASSQFAEEIELAARAQLGEHDSVEFISIC